MDLLDYYGVICFPIAYISDGDCAGIYSRNWYQFYTEYAVSGEIIMSRVTYGLLGDYELGLTLDRYQELVRIPINAFNGINKPIEATCQDCAYIWKQTDRDAMAIAIAQAEERRIEELGYFPYPQYSTEDLDYQLPLILKRKHLVAVGSKACTLLSAGVAITLRTAGVINDPVTILVATTVTDPNEITIRYPGEEVDIRPSKVSISGGIATIQIPRARILDPDVDTNCDPAPDYTTDANFLTSVDVYRCYTDPNIGAYLYWKDVSCILPSPFTCYCDSGFATFNDITQQAYPDIRNNRLAIVNIYPGSYSGGVWTPETATKCRKPWKVRVTYLSGRQRSVLTEMSTARLAHTILPELIPDRLVLCTSCWQFDQVVDKGAPITPYGSARAAIKVWMSDSRQKIGQGGKFPSMRSAL